MPAPPLIAGRIPSKMRTCIFAPGRRMRRITGLSYYRNPRGNTE